jgi:hypothetical protein
MVDELTQETFQTGKAVVSVSVDILMAIAEACKKSEEKNQGMTSEQKDTLVQKVANKVASSYKETHGSLKTFNREGRDVAHIDVNDERTANILEKSCKKAHIPVDMQQITRADGSQTFTAFCEVKSLDQLAGLLKVASAQVLEEQQAMTKNLTLVDEHGQEMFSQDFVKDSDIDYDKLSAASEKAVSFKIKDFQNETLDSGELKGDVKTQIKEKAKALNPKQDKSLKERIQDKKEQAQEKQQDKNRQREKSRKKTRNASL